jgi:hypothetical protein
MRPTEGDFTISRHGRNSGAEGPEKYTKENIQSIKAEGQI